MTVVAFMGTQGLGDFIAHHMCSASVARAFPNNRLVAVYRDDRPYKNFITALNSHVTDVVAVPADAGQVVPLDWFDGNIAHSHMPTVEDWYVKGLNRPDIFLVPYMMGAGTYRDWGPPVKFQVPTDAVEPLSRALELSGIEPERWFVGLHMRENYHLRKDVDLRRSVDPATYIPMITRIIAEQGGQVVRIGDSSMTPLPRIEGLVDLCFEPDSFPLQAFATSRARYFISTDSGPQSLACAFKVPTAMTNTVGFGVWNDGDVVLPRKVTLANGEVPDPGTVMEVAVATHHLGMLADPEYVDNTPEQLCAVADHMFEATTDCPGWRRQSPEPEVAASGHVIMPLPWHDISRSADVTVWGATERPSRGTESAGRKPALLSMERVCAETGISPGEYVYAHRAAIRRDREEETRRVRRIVALFGATCLGDFILENVVAAFIARRFPEAYVLAGFRDDPQTRRFVTECNGRLDATMAFPGDSSATFLVDWFDNGMYAPVCGPQTWQERRMTASELVLVSSMLRLDAAHLAGLGESPPVFRLPPERKESLRGELVGLGLDPDRWFACLHVNEGDSFEDERGADPAAYLSLVVRLIEVVGGQVVRLGAPGSAPMPQMDGFIDLTRMTNSFALQVAAIQFARFFLGTDSGLLTLASSFKVPSAGTNMVGYIKRLWNRGDVVLAKPIRMPDGSLRRTIDAYQYKNLDGPLPKGARYVDNSSDELLGVAEHMLRETTDCSGWRSPSDPTEPIERGPFCIPLPMRDETLLRFWE